MKTKITIEIENEDEIELVRRVADVLDGAGLGPSVEADLPEAHEAVWRALQENPGRSRRIVHRAAAEAEGSPFDDPEDTGEGSERRRVGTALWDLESRGLARHEGNRWYPG